jgi:hypothetical protein
MSLFLHFVKIIAKPHFRRRKSRWANSICGVQQFDYLVAPQYKPQEVAKSDWAAVRKASPWAIDSWGLGMFAERED